MPYDDPPGCLTFPGPQKQNNSGKDRTIRLNDPAVLQHGGVPGAGAAAARRLPLFPALSPPPAPGPQSANSPWATLPPAAWCGYAAMRFSGSRGVSSSKSVDLRGVNSGNDSRGALPFCISAARNTIVSRSDLATIHI
jgi:hypothetical protein